MALRAAVASMMLVSVLGMRVGEEESCQLDADAMVLTPDDDYDSLKDGAGAAKDGFLGIFKVGKTVANGEGDIDTLGSAVASISVLIPFVLPPPGCIVAASVLGVAGGIMSAFKTPAKEAQDVLIMMSKGFNDVQAKLEQHGVKLDAMQHQLESLGLSVQAIKTKMTEQWELHVDVLKEIQTGYLSVQEWRNKTVTTPRYIDDLRKESTEWADKFQRERHGEAALSPSNVQKALRHLDACQAGQIYKMILSARFQLLFLKLVASSTSTLPAVERQEDSKIAFNEFLHDMKSYKDTVERYYSQSHFHFGEGVKIIWRLWEEPDEKACHDRDGMFAVFGHKLYRQPLSGLTDSSKWNPVKVSDSGVESIAYRVESIAVKSHMIYATDYDGQVYKQLISKMEAVGYDGSWDLISDRGALKSIVVRGDTLYGVGVTGAVWKQLQSSMTLSSDWFEVSMGVVKSIAIKFGTMYGVATNGKVVMQNMGLMTRSTDWNMAGNGLVDSIAIIGDTIYAVGPLGELFSQILTSMTKDTEWRLVQNQQRRWEWDHPPFPSLTAIAGIDEAADKEVVVGSATTNLVVESDAATHLDPLFALRSAWRFVLPTKKLDNHKFAVEFINLDSSKRTLFFRANGDLNGPDSIVQVPYGGVALLHYDARYLKKFLIIHDYTGICNQIPTSASRENANIFVFKGGFKKKRGNFCDFIEMSPDDWQKGGLERRFCFGEPSEKQMADCMMYLACALTSIYWAKPAYDRVGGIIQVLEPRASCPSDFDVVGKPGRVEVANRPGVQHAGSACLEHCGKRNAGPCDWCGTDGLCCYHSFQGVYQTGGCGGTFMGVTTPYGCHAYHCCVAK